MHPSHARILDANFNRSREALRVMEEYARFVLNDASLSIATKSTRHDLTAAFRALPPTTVVEDAGLVAHRDIVGDVGTSISTPAELQRSTAVDVLTAACKRLTESLRCLEEYGKLIDLRFASNIERLRYRAYDLERRLIATLCARAKFAGMRLYVLITQSLCTEDWFETARKALAGGADCLQLREKSLPDRELLERARRLAQLCRDMQKVLIVNDRPDIALAAGAHGVHLGQEDLPLPAARRVLPAHMILGVSTHTVAQVEAAIAESPDYIAVGPMFDSPTKPQPLVAGAGLLTEARKRTALPLVAIGGIDASNTRTILAAATACICVCRAVVTAPDPEAAARKLRVQIEGFVPVQNF